jgi:AcrR family transcriptional regulator
MESRPQPVKGKRAYDARLRRDNALRNRDRIVDIALRRFTDDGYAATTVASIATEAGVSADTIYKSFGGKPGLVRAIRARALRGAGEVPAEDRSDRLHTGELSGREIIEAWGRLTAEVAPRVAPVLLLVRAAAATDREVEELVAEMDADRLRRMHENAIRLRDGGHLRAGITVAKAADILWTYSAPELYELVVLRRGWSAARYGRFAAEAMIAALLPPD